MPTAPDPRPPQPGPHVLVVFGATGDLARRKLFPGLFHLTRAGLMPDAFRIIGSGRHAPEGGDAGFRDLVRAALDEHGRQEGDDASWAAFAERLSFVASSADDGEDLAQAVRDAETGLGDGARRLIYLSVPPGASKPMVGMLGATGLTERARIVMEKPFGTDLASACELNAALHERVGEDQVFRIDHFLGKEAAQNILAFRFANGLFEPVWNRDHIASIQIDVPEELGIEGRGVFYEQTGAVRDMVVTHLFQLLGFVALEPPVRLDAQGLRDEKAKVFQAVAPLDPARVVLGQFDGYPDEPGVAADSRTETFAALEVAVESWRWSGVPFLLRTGKAMAEGHRTITIAFKEPPLAMFRAAVDGHAPRRPNELVFDLSDDPQVTVDLRAKAPGPALTLGPASLRLDFADAFDGQAGLEAYERLLHDVMLGDHTLFTRSDEVERLWEIAAPILARPPAPLPYPKGSWGPEAALALAGRDGWRLPGQEG